MLRDVRKAASVRLSLSVSGSAQLIRAAMLCPGDPAGIRDRALLLLLANASLGRSATARRRSTAAPDGTDSGAGHETGVPAQSDAPAAAIATLARTTLLGLEAEQMRFTHDGLELTLMDGDETDARSYVIHLARQPHFTACPVHALED